MRLGAGAAKHQRRLRQLQLSSEEVVEILEFRVQLLDRRGLSVFVASLMDH